MLMELISTGLDTPRPADGLFLFLFLSRDSSYGMRHRLMLILTPNSRSVFRAGVSLNIHSFFLSFDAEE